MPERRMIYVLMVTALLSVPLYVARDEMDTEEIRKNRYWVAKSRSEKSYPIVFGGDSRVFRGLSPDHFDAEFPGYEAHNYAFWSNGMGRVYLEGIERKLDTASDLQVIVLGITPHSLTPNAARCEHYLYEMSRSKEQVLQHLYLSRLQEIFAPYRALELADKLTGRSKPANYRITYHPNGWVESYWIQPDTGYSARFYEEIFTENRVSGEVISGLLEYVQRWTRNGVHVVGFRPPTSRTIQNLEHERGGFDEGAFVEQFTAAGGFWVPVDNDAYRTFDGNHVEHLSAARLSADLARSVRDKFVLLEH